MLTAPYRGSTNFIETSPAQIDRVPAEMVQNELRKILASKIFCNSPRLSRFLRFIVEQTIEGHEDGIKEYLLGVDVFERGVSYDPRIDPIVRVEAGRLRAKLQQYYESEGAESSLIFELPKGRYIPSFHRRSSPTARVEFQVQARRFINARTALLALAGVLFTGVSYRLLHSVPRNVLATSPAHTPPGATAYGAQLAASDNVSSIAVLPFEDLSLRKNQAYFCDGMTETLIDALTKVDGLRVAARSSAFSLRQTPWDLENIGAKLHVAAVLEGSVRKEERKLRVSVHLVNVSDGLNIWSETYDRNFQDVFAIQDEIADAIVNALRTHFLPSVRTASRLAKTYTRDPEAYSLYLKGHYLLGGVTRQETEKAVSYFTKAIQRDPNYALAYAGIADAYNLVGTSNLEPPHQVMPKAKAAAAKALSIDGSLAEAHAALGLVESTYDWNWRGAEQEFKRSIELNPGYVSAYHWYGLTCLASTGRTTEALATIRKARDLDPLSLFTSTNLATILMRLGRYDEAIQLYLDTIDIAPSFFWAYRDLGLAFNQKHMFAESIGALEKANSISDGNPGVLAALGYCYAVDGRKGSALDILGRLQQLSKQAYVPPYHIAAIYVGLSDNQRALDWLDRAYDDRSAWMNGIKVDPIFASLRDEPRFVMLLKKMNL